MKLKEKLLARDVRNLELELTDIPHDRMLLRSSFSHHESMLKAAIGAGWIEDPEVKKREVTEGKKTFVEYWFNGAIVDDMLPNEVYRLGNVIERLYQEFTSLDPNS